MPVQPSLNSRKAQSGADRLDRSQWRCVQLDLPSSGKCRVRVACSVRYNFKTMRHQSVDPSHGQGRVVANSLRLKRAGNLSLSQHTNYSVFPAGVHKKTATVRKEDHTASLPFLAGQNVKVWSDVFATFTYKHYILLGRNALWSGRNLPTFQGEKRYFLCLQCTSWKMSHLCRIGSFLLNSTGYKNITTKTRHVYNSESYQPRGLVVRASAY